MSVSSGKILQLESLRGIAALVVAFYHFPSDFILTDNLFVKNGALMVDFFFVLSGFVIALSYLDRISEWSTLVSFQLRRFWRLYPLHLITLIFFFAMEAIKPVLTSQLGLSFGTPAFSISTVPDFFWNLTLTHSIFSTEMGYNYPSWSISTEFITYFIFGLLLLAPHFARVPLFIGMVLLGFSVTLAFSELPLEDTVGLGIWRCFYCFFLGVLTFILMSKIPPLRFGDLTGILSLAISVLAVVYLAHTPVHIFIPLLFCALVLVMAALREDTVTWAALNWRPMVWLGTISYSVYMIHPVIWFIVSRGGRILFDFPLVAGPGGAPRLALTGNTAIITTLLGLVLLLIVSHMSYLLIENRFRYGLRGRKAQG